MALTKRLQKVSSSSLALILNQEMLKTIGADIGSPEVNVSLRIFDDALVVRLADAPLLNLQQVGQLFGLEPWDSALTEELDFSNVTPALREVLEVLEGGSATSAQLGEMLGLTHSAIGVRLMRAVSKGYVIREGIVYSLNRDLFS